MTTTLTSRTRTTAASLFGALVHAVGAAAARRSQRIALNELLRMDPARLDDLGINQQDIVDAMRATPPAGPVLAARRAEHASGHLSAAMV